MSTQSEKIYLAKETLEKYKKEYEQLVNVERPAVQNALKEARAQGDLSENAEYDAARDRQGLVEGRINELESILDRAEIIENAHSASIGIGATVTLKFLETGEIKKITIMGTHDANPFEDKISNKSPLAVAILGRKAGDAVEVDAQQKFNVEIMNVTQED
ncbi:MULTISPECIES: transcription elongation factor GreA [unclassified Mycoplasma]|uniref:transcription elongation factor GreA n=1 Tax=unclassified Mycoplasma TaxID=2683645 RepID=UPI00211CCAE8|nr:MULTISPECIES: transcription elongation factor GreA [unclassified Mycoplasma]UUM19642.1 transcription elongation factor GreA [Mycoplasma sp. 1578d]UUM24611.1 transcription elongation factor GreA [Mycoplasma sp. 3686d]